ncbi:hypothetical protein ACL02T_18000 [Pseudonocardia sp. RS010]|uniref:hypothetical protein n=1 Tax=Pseudonocardia sp. RS010 TaxID=3385979 RepID=UPI0039A34882
MMRTTGLPADLHGDAGVLHALFRRRDSGSRAGARTDGHRGADEFGGAVGSTSRRARNDRAA